MAITSSYTRRPTTVDSRNRKMGGQAQGPNTMGGQPRGTDQWGNPIDPYSEDVKKRSPSWTQRSISQAQTAAQALPQWQQYASGQVDPYTPTIGGAQGNLNTLFGGPGGSPSESPYMNYGMDLLTSAGRGRPNMPTAPEMSVAGGYTPRGIGGHFDYSTMNLGGYPTAANGPNLSAVNDPNRFGMAGPNVENPIFAELMGYVNQGNVNAPGRETFGMERFSGDPLAMNAFREATSAATGIGGALPDISGTYDQIFKQAATTGANKAGGRGFTDLGGTMAGKAIGQEMGLAAERAAAERSGLELEAARLGQSGREATASALTSTGAASADAASDVNRANLDSSLGFGGLGVEQREQDVTLARDAMNRGTSASDVANLLEAKNRGVIGSFEAGTARGTAQGQMGLSADELTRGGELDSFRAGIEDRNSLMEGVRAGNADAIARYREATARGEVTGDWSRDMANLQSEYDKLDSANQNVYQDRLLDRYSIGGDQANAAYGQETNRLNTLLSGAGNFANTAQTGDLGRQENQIRIGQLAQQALAGGQAGQQAQMTLFERVLSGDRDAYNAILTSGLDRQLTEYMDAKKRDAAKGGIGGFLGGAVGSVVGSIGGPIGTAIGNRIGSSIGGG